MPIEMPQSDGPPQGGVFDVPVPADSPTSFSALPSSTLSPPPRHAPRPHKGRPLIIGVGIASAAIISLLAISLLYYRWYKYTDYDATILVWGEDAWKGATVSVTGLNLPSGGLWAELTEKDNLFIRFHVPPGNYRVRVQKDGQTLALKASDPKRPLISRMIWWPFRAPPAATQASRP